MTRSALAASTTALRRVLFLDEANHCFGRFCEELFNDYAAVEATNWLAFSRSLRPLTASRYLGPIDAAALAQLVRRNVRPVNHQRLPLGVTHFDFVTADHVVVLDADRCRPLLSANWPAATAVFWPLGTGGPRSPAVFQGLDARVRLLVRELAAQSSLGTLV